VSNKITPPPPKKSIEPLSAGQAGKNKNLVPQTIDEYFVKEVKPHLQGAWIDESKTKIGYEINFTKYFYEFKPLRSLADIKADILALEESTLELEKKVLTNGK